MNKRKTTIQYLLFIVLATSLVFIINNSLFHGYLQSETRLDDELWTKGQSLSNWDISKHAPYKYRILFKTIVSESHQLLFSSGNNTAFYYTYIFWSLTFFTLAAIAFFYLLKEVHFSSKLSFGGALLFLTCPPAVLAYSEPVHSREDSLAYFILCIGLIAIIRNKYYAVLLITVIGTTCRETLLLIPFIYLFFTDNHLIKRLSVTLLGFATWVGLKYFLGYESYNIYELGLFYNIEKILQAPFFFFMTFYVLWIPFLIDISPWKKLARTNDNMQIIRKSAPWVFLLVISTTFVGGRFNETRLIFLMFPWVISIALFYLYKYWAAILYVVKQSNYKKYILVTFLILLTAAIIFLGQVHFGVSEYGVRYGVWAGVSLFYLYLSLLTLPIIIHLIKVKNTPSLK